MTARYHDHLALERLRSREHNLRHKAEGSLWEAVALGVLAAAGISIVLFWLRDPRQLLDRLSTAHAQLHATVAQLGFWAPIALIVAYAALMLLICVPSWPCTMLAGFLFGPIPGAVYSLIGSTLGAIGVFELAKSGLAHRMPREHPLILRLDAGFRRDALEYVIALRIMPIMPFGIIHVAAGVLGISLRVFTLGTIIGMVPCLLIYAYLGSDLDRVAAHGGTLNVATLTQPSVVLPLVAMAALALVPILFRRIRSRLAIAKSLKGSHRGSEANQNVGAP